MNEKDYKIADDFKQKMIENHIPVQEIIVFGSRARGDADSDSDLDILVIVKEKNSTVREQVYECAWEVGFEENVIIQTVIMTEQQARQGPEKSSLLMMAVNQEGVKV